jgi:tetratricopeptide (TPR) repeat protein
MKFCFTRLLFISLLFCCLHAQTLGQGASAVPTANESLNYRLQALAAIQPVKEPFTEAGILHNIAVKYDGLGEPHKALEYFQQALKSNRSAQNITNQSSILRGLGEVHFRLGNFRAALDYGRQALELSQKAGIARTETRGYLFLGQVWRELGDDEQSLHYLTQALQNSRTTEDRAAEAQIADSLGSLYQQQGNWQLAAEYWRQAETFYQQMKDHNGQASVLLSRGQGYERAGEGTNAHDAYQKSLQLAREVINPLHEANTLLHLARLMRRQSNLTAAANYAQQALTLTRVISAPRYEADVLQEAARIAMKQGNYVAAQKQIEQALTLLETFRSSVASQELRTGFRSTINSFYDVWIESLMQQHAQQPSGNFAALAFAAIEQARARSLLETLSESHTNIRQGVDPALVQRERELQQRLAAKAELLTRRRPTKAAQAELAELQKEVQMLLIEHRALTEQIRASSPAYAALTNPQPLNLSGVQQQLLDANTLLLEYYLGEERSYLFAVTANSLHTFTLPKRATITPLAQQFYEAVANAGRPISASSLAQMAAQQKQAVRAADAAGAALSQELIAPAAALLGTKRLLIVGEGALQYVPFGAIPSPPSPLRVSGFGFREQNAKRETQNAKLKTQNSKPMIAAHEIITLPSASTLAVLQSGLAARPSAPQTIAILADPVFEADDDRLRSIAQTTKPASNLAAELQRAHRDSSETTERGNFVRLPFTRAEADAILAVAPKSQTKIALNFAANRAAATNGELAHYRYVHFATHGLLNNVHPELSGLVLSLVNARGQPQNGFLRTMDIFNLQLNAELVVLSGCRTGLGKDIRGEGLVGLTRGFMYAGSKRVMASLWNVSDEATAQLMRKFYQGLFGPQQLSPAAALRAAQLALRRESRWQSPYYWASFVMQGEW